MHNSFELIPLITQISFCPREVTYRDNSGDPTPNSQTVVRLYAVATKRNLN